MKTPEPGHIPPWSNAVDPAYIGWSVRWGGHEWTIKGIDYLGQYELERFEDRPDGRYKIGGSCVLGLSQDHGHYAVLIGPSQPATDAERLAWALVFVMESPGLRMDIIKYTRWMAANGSQRDASIAQSVLPVVEQPMPSLTALRSVAGERQEQWIIDHAQIDGNASYIVCAIGQRPDGSTYLYDAKTALGWQFKQRLKGCYAAIPMPEWKGLPTEIAP